MKINKSSALVLCMVIFFAGVSFAEENPLHSMRDDLLSYFKPVKGKVVSAASGTAVIDIGSISQVRKGMRLTVFREGTPFLHPVTKEPLGLLDKVTGKTEVKDVGPDKSTVIILSGEVKESDKVRISETGIRVLFYQGKNVDWSLADSYYRTLKETGRFELVDTALETTNDSDVVAEAKKLGADLALVLSASDAEGDTMLRQKLFWTDNSTVLASNDMKIAAAFIKELKFGEEFFGPRMVEQKLFVDLPFGVNLIASGDVDGDGKADFMLSTGKDIRVYEPGGEFKGEFKKIYEIKGSGNDDHLWLDALDLNRNGRAEIILTLMRSDSVVSRIYELQGKGFVVLWEGNVFLRRIGSELIAQAYASDDGYKGPVFAITWDGGYKKGANINLPKGINIYDFAFINESEGKKLVFAYDDDGYLNVYDEGKRIWRSSADYGGFQRTFKKASPTVMVDRGVWSVKDRLTALNKEVFVIKRIPVVGTSKGLGYSKSQIKSLWWTGISIEERTVIEDIPGNALDYSLTADKLVVLDRPAFGLKIQNLLKLENPLGTVLYIYSLMGK